MHPLPRRLAILALLPLPLLTGCSTLLTVAYLVQPADMPAEFNELKGSKFAVVCRPIIELEFTDAGSARELATLVGGQIEDHVRRSSAVGQHEVSRWIDENEWTDYQAVGGALGVDHVVGIDLEEFRLHEGSTLYRGRAAVNVRVYDIKEKKVVFQKRFDDFAFPSNNAIPSTDMSEAEFRGTFLRILSQRISRLFHAYESREVFAEESLTW